jgi:MFS family permease
VSYRDALAHPSFRRFWLGFTGSALGDAMSRVALIWFVYEETRSPAAVGALTFAYSAPILVGGLVAGPLLDRFDRRRVMLADNLVRGAAFAAIPLLHAAGWLALWHVYVVAAVYGLLMMVSLAGGPALVPSLVPPELLATANAMEMLSFTLGNVLGPALAGLFLPLVGAPNLLAFDAASYLAFALALARIEAPPRTAEAPAARGRGLGPALRLLRREPVLSTTTLMFLTYNLGAGGLTVWLPVLADRVLGGHARLYGALLACIALGEVAAALAAGRWRPRWPLGAMICASQVMAGLALLAALAASLSPWGTPLVALALVGWGAASAPLTIWAQTLRMRIIPPALRGRTFALLRTIMQGGRPLGALTAGALLPVAGIPAMMALSALLASVPGLLGSRVRALREAGAAVER